MGNRNGGGVSASGAGLRFDHTGTASFDGTWDFFPGDHPLQALSQLTPQPIQVPGLWETQGYPDLDGVAWYRRFFDLDDDSGFWTCKFGAVMDIADVYLNGSHLGSHDIPFTPFELDPRPALRRGRNELLVKVFDPALDDPEHLLQPHGKQGWANEVFPSRPSLYMTFGGIWQSVTLRRHGPLVIDRVFVKGDPDDLKVEVTVTNRGDGCSARLSARAVYLLGEESVDFGAGERRTVGFELGPTPARRWSPGSPALHTAQVDVVAGDRLSDSRDVRFGLRKIEIEGTRLLVDRVPYRMKAALVQGFRADGSYAEGSRHQIEDEVRKARAMGFNTLRLHIKAFDPLYLDVCDEMGMFVYSDIPIVEPIDHGQLGSDSVFAVRCRRAAREQVSRDRNHPSILMWSAMNELCLECLDARDGQGYAEFVRAMVSDIQAADSTRPVIENDWVEPDPDRVFVSPILTAHWYGRLHADYLETIERKSNEWSDVGMPLFVSEFGDWGLPAMPRLDAPPFWDTHEIYAAGLAAALWPGSLARFVEETQRYQGISDRLQAEVFRRHDRLGGYCVTELTDVPHELNGLLDLNRNVKRAAAEEMARANQVVLPILKLDSLVMEAGSPVGGKLFVANDGPELAGVEIGSGFEAAVDPVVVVVPVLPGYRASDWGEVTLKVPEVPGGHDLVVALTADGVEVARNRYPVHVVDSPGPVGPLRVVGENAWAGALAAVGAVAGEEGPLVVMESALGAKAGEAVRQLLERGETVLILAQENPAHFPVELNLVPLATAWGSSVFRFTNDRGWMPSLPRRRVLTTEDSTIHPATVVVGVGGKPFPDDPIVIAYKPAPDPLTGTLIGCTSVGSGRMVFCQYRVCERAAAGDVAARAVLADLLLARHRLDRVAGKERTVKPDGRALQVWTLPGGSAE